MDTGDGCKGEAVLLAQAIYSALLGDPEGPPGRQQAEQSLSSRFFLENSLPCCRFAVLVPRKWGKAVRRNRARRVIREILRIALPELRRGMDVLVLPRRQFEANDYCRVREELHGFFEALGLKEVTEKKR